jgi:hypothetical protein
MFNSQPFASPFPTNPFQAQNKHQEEPKKGNVYLNFIERDKDKN